MSGEQHTGEALPAMHVVAKSIHVSVITVQAAYEDLQRDGFIDTTGVRGFFCYHKKLILVEPMREPRRYTRFIQRVSDGIFLHPALCEAVRWRG